MSKHTPGPWFAFIKGDTIAVGTAKNGREVDAVVHWSGFDSCGVDHVEQRANARLIAAAPDMLAALKLVEAALAVGNGINRRSQPIGGKTYISQLKAAIAKAQKI